MCDYDEKCGDDGGDDEVMVMMVVMMVMVVIMMMIVMVQVNKKMMVMITNNGKQHKEPGNATVSCVILCNSLCLPMPLVMNASPVCGNTSAAAKESSETSLAHSSAFT